MDNKIGVRNDTFNNTYYFTRSYVFNGTLL